MFRQQSQVECYCSLFPQTNLQFKPFRSPQKTNYRAHQQSKISLKYSSQNHKPELNKISLTKHHLKNNHQQNKENGLEKLKRCTSSFFVETPPPEKLYPLGNIEPRQDSYYPNPNYMSVNHSKNMIQPRLIKKDLKNPVYMHHQQLQPINRNQDYYPQIRQTTIQMLKEKSPSFTKLFQTKTQNSTITTLAESMMPNKDTKKAYITKMDENKYFKSLISQGQTQKQNFYVESIQRQYSLNQTYRTKQTKKEQVYITTQSHGMLSKLSQILNEKEEAQSIYDNQTSRPGANDIQYSRVLISCKKLMSQKNGFLQASLQTRLFDGQPNHHHQNTSLMFHFDKIKIQ